MKITHERTIHSLIYLSIIALSGLTGILTRIYPQVFPSFIAKYAGDTLWSFALFFLVSIFFHERSVRFRFILTLIISLADELSQLYHAPWIDHLRSTIPGGLILGYSFAWSDLPCYLAGALLASSLTIVFINRESEKIKF